MTRVQAAILQALRFGPVELFELAAAVDEAPFRVRAELQVLRRRRLVDFRLKAVEHGEWRLTDAGLGVVWGGQQEVLF